MSSSVDGAPAGEGVQRAVQGGEGSFVRGEGGRLFRTAGRERGRQDDHVPDADRRRAADQRECQHFGGRGPGRPGRRSEKGKRRCLLSYKHSISTFSYQVAKELIFFVITFTDKIQKSKIRFFFRANK